MQKQYGTWIQGLILSLAIAFTFGCASTDTGRTGAQVKAIKGISSTGDDSGAGGSGLIPRADLAGEQIPLTELEEYKSAGLCQRIHFDYDKAEIKPEWVDCLNNVAAFFADKPQYILIIEGHCDKRGTNEYNIILGENRAKITAEFLIERGMSGQRIVTRSWGEERPLAQGDSEEAWAQNRRAEFFYVEQ